MCGYHFTLYHSTYVASSFWIHLKFFGSFQTNLNFLDHFRLNFFLCLWGKKSTFFWKGPKWPQMAKNIFGTLLDHIGTFGTLASCHVWPFLRTHALSIWKVNNLFVSVWNTTVPWWVSGRRHFFRWALSWVGTCTTFLPQLLTGISLKFKLYFPGIEIVNVFKI